VERFQPARPQGLEGQAKPAAAGSQSQKPPAPEDKPFAEFIPPLFSIGRPWTKEIKLPMEVRMWS